MAELLELLALLVAGLVVAAVYFLPWLVAVRRDSDKVYPVAVINLFFGWSLVGWVVALAVALWPKEEERR